MENAVNYLIEHPEAVNKSGRELADTIQINDNYISYKTWNEAKKRV